MRAFTLFVGTHIHGRARCFLRVAWEGRERRERKKERVEGVRKYDRVVDGAKKVGESGLRECGKRTRRETAPKETKWRHARTKIRRSQETVNQTDSSRPFRGCFCNDHGPFPAPPSRHAVTSTNKLLTANIKSKIFNIAYLQYLTSLLFVYYSCAKILELHAQSISLCYLTGEYYVILIHITYKIYV